MGVQIRAFESLKTEQEERESNFTREWVRAIASIRIEDDVHIMSAYLNNLYARAE